MKVNTTMCYSHLLAMLTKAKEVSEACSNISFAQPDLINEGYHGYIPVSVVFSIKNLEVFTKLFEDSRNLVTPEIYRKIKEGTFVK